MFLGDMRIFLYKISTLLSLICSLNVYSNEDTRFLRWLNRNLSDLNNCKAVKVIPKTDKSVFLRILCHATCSQKWIAGSCSKKLKKECIYDRRYIFSSVLIKNIDSHRVYFSECVDKKFRKVRFYTIKFLSPHGLPVDNTESRTVNNFYEVLAKVNNDPSQVNYYFNNKEKSWVAADIAEFTEEVDKAQKILKAASKAKYRALDPR